MKIKYLNLLLLLFFVTITSNCFAETGKSFIWEVKSDKTTIYLLGSVHIGKESLFPLKPVIEDAFKKSNNLAVELDITNVNPFELIKYMTFQDTNTLQSSLSPVNYERIAKVFKENSVPEMVYYKLKPWAAVMMAQQLGYGEKGYSSGAGIDMYFLNRAKGVGEYAAKDSAAGAPQKKNVLELESAEFQLKLFDEFNSASNSFVEYSMEEIENTSDSNELDRIYKSWQKGDPNEIEELIMDSQNKFPEYKNIMESLLYKRNISMSAKIEEWLNTKDTYFVVVGAAHLVGKKGIVELLTKSNKYKIKQL